MSGKFAMTTFLGGLAQSRKAPINFIMSVRPSVRGFHWKAFREISGSKRKNKSVQKIKISFEPEKMSDT
jgi:hypothetical protein